MPNQEHIPVIEQVFLIEAGDFTSAGEVSGKIKKLLKQLGVDANIVRRTAIACYEAELNLVIHSLGGQIIFIVKPKEINIITEDIGPGIPDVELAMTEGYSTASEKARELGFGAGMGLSNIKRCADKIEIQSKVGQGTRMKAVIMI
ncbi:MAG: anti-sigma regulatory factor [Firmicutes bacterium]|nr:anti-sigma regulatory factor [Bacillota bacterium]